MGLDLAEEEHSGSVFRHLDELKRLAAQEPTPSREFNSRASDINSVASDMGPDEEPGNDSSGSRTPLAITGTHINPEQLATIAEEMGNEVDQVETARLKYLSEHDELTGQKNRIKLNEALEEQISWSKKNNLFSSLIIAGIDNLAVINDTFGYQLGDEVITAVARELSTVLRKRDVIGRYAANKFGLILPRCGPDALHSASSRLLGHIADKHILTSKGLIPVTISIGGVVVPRHAETGDEALSRALEALDRTKQKGSNTYVIYEHHSDREATRKHNLYIADEIISALNDQRMYLSLQPIVSAKTREVAHQECLLVMECQNGEIINAGRFIPIAEKLGLCRLIDFRTLDLSMEMLKKDPDLKLAINVSSLTMRDPNYLVVMNAQANRDRQILERITIEITETVSIDDFDEAESFVATLHDLGFKVAIDDFGAGYSSYRYLRSLNADIVKIDGDYIKNVTTSKDDQIIVRSLIDLAKAFHLETVAEWVTDEATARYMEEAGIDYLQGFGIGKPEIALREISDETEIDTDAENAIEVEADMKEVS